MKHHHQTEVEAHPEVVRELNEVEDSDKLEARSKDSRQTEEHREETTNTLAEDLVEVKILTEDPEDHMIMDKNHTEAQGEVLTRGREEDVLPNPINMQRRDTVQFARKGATITCYTVPNSQTSSQEVQTSYQSLRKYASSVSPQQGSPLRALTSIRLIIKIGCAMRTN